MSKFYIIGNIQIKKKITVSKNIIAHPFSPNQDLHLIKNTNLNVTVLQTSFLEIPVEETKKASFDNLFSSDYHLVSRYLSCLQLTQLSCYDYNQTVNREILVPMGFIINKLSIEGESFEELKPEEIKIIDVCSAAIPFYTGSYGFDAAADEAKGDFEEAWKLFERCSEIISRESSNEEKKISILLKNILFRYYLAKTSTDILYSVFNYMSIIESMYGDREEIKGSIQRRVPKLLGDKTENISKFLKKMYDERSVLAHNKTDYEFGMHGDRGIDDRERVILANIAGWLIDIWMKKVFDGQDRKSIKKSIDSM